MPLRGNGNRGHNSIVAWHRLTHFARATPVATVARAPAPQTKNIAPFADSPQAITAKKMDENMTSWVLLQM